MWQCHSTKECETNCSPDPLFKIFNFLEVNSLVESARNVPNLNTCSVFLSEFLQKARVHVRWPSSVLPMRHLDVRKFKIQLLCHAGVLLKLSEMILILCAHESLKTLLNERQAAAGSLTLERLAKGPFRGRRAKTGSKFPRSWFSSQRRWEAAILNAGGCFATTIRFKHLSYVLANIMSHIMTNFNTLKIFCHTFWQILTLWKTFCHTSWWI